MNDTYPLKGYLRDENGTLLNAYRTQGHLYYKSQSRSDKRVNISESKLYEALEDIVKIYDEKWVQFSSFSQAIIKDLLEEKLQEKEAILESIAKDIHNIEMKLSSLLDMKLDEKVTLEIFEIKNAQLMKELEELKDRKEKIEKLKIEKIHAIQEKMVELSGSLYRRYKSGNISEKSHLVKSMMVELFVSTKKELTVKENKLFGFIKSCSVPYGASNGTRTHNSRHGKAVL
jgi:Rad3-related DNA helicase